MVMAPTSTFVLVVSQDKQVIRKKRQMAKLFFFMLINLYSTIKFLGYGDRFSVGKDIQWVTFCQSKFGPFMGNSDFNGMVPKVYLKGIGVPLFRDLWLECQGVIAYPHSSKTFHDTHPSAGHRSDMQPFLHLFVIVVQI